MPPYAISDFTAAMPSIVQDGASRLGELDGYAISAILNRYSKDAPLEIVSDIPGNGTNLLPLPVDPAEIAIFDPLFSTIRTIEFPIEQMPPQYVLDSDLSLYRTPAGYFIALNFDTPGPGDLLRVTWTAAHAATGATVPGKDFYAVVDYAASLALESLAASYAQTGDPSLSADVVNYRSKAQEYLGLAKAIRKRYYTHMGVEESTAAGGGEAAPSLAIGNQWLEQNSGVDRLVHGKYSR
jgi:hypothetical protein